MDELAERLNKAVRYLVWKGYVSIQSMMKYLVFQHLPVQQSQQKKNIMMQ